jgi:hypothetical protein
MSRGLFRTGDLRTIGRLCFFPISGVTLLLTFAEGCHTPSQSNRNTFAALSSANCNAWIVHTHIESGKELLNAGLIAREIL